MNKVLPLNRNLINFGIPLLLLGILILVIKSSFLNGNDTLSFAITADLLLTVPFVYFLLIHKSKIPKTTVIPVMLVGLLVGSYFLPKESQTYLEVFKNWALPIIELSILFFIILKIRKAIKTYKRLHNKSLDFYTILKDTCSEILPKKLVIPFATEVAVFYYGFINWRKSVLKPGEYSYHKNSGTISLLVAIIFIIGVETVVLHILLAKWSAIAAWILSILSIYTAIQLFGFLKSMLKRPILIENNTLYLRYGIMNESVVPIKAIDSVELFTKGIKLDRETRKLSFLGELESHNVMIRLKKEHTLTGLYGIKRNFKVLVLHVDNKIEFVNQLNNALEQNP
ncbi:hypothetical protein MTsPCn9_24770 [Croceitalea sp. MTPC9]|uniref:hypothetical protein n=1 Tax=unclassified Croceitalea TaxID=2632280 RepID=UPI002B38B4F1|nr:hypothetical protein MTsPCn6_18760 [Croceitalea sp. MTPC6]GMN17539.1 hypothetical protein MTsPCn9_24770 [Croceitalea sp. MTPC9]